MVYLIIEILLKIRDECNSDCQFKVLTKLMLSSGRVKVSMYSEKEEQFLLWEKLAF